MQSAPSAIAETSVITFAPAFAAPGTLAEVDALIDQRLDPQPLRERRRQHDPGVRDRPLVIERDRDAVQSDRPVNMHHEGDLLSQAATAAIGRFSLLRRSFFVHAPDGTRRAAGGSRLSVARLPRRRADRFMRQPQAYANVLPGWS